MAKVYLNIDVQGVGKIWEAQNGSTKTTLVLTLSKKDFPEDIKIKANQPIIASIGYLTEKNSSFIFLNKSDKDDQVLGVFTNNAYSYTCLNSDTEIFSDSSQGGYGNSASRFGIYKEGAIIQSYTYKNRTPNTFVILKDNGWKYLGAEENIIENLDVDEDCKKIAELKGWLNEINYID